MPDQSDALNPVAQICPGCGSGNEPASNFCRNCGHNLSGAGVPADAPPPSSPWSAPESATPPMAPPPPAYYYAPPGVQKQSTNGFAIASMVLGIIWIYWVGSILALVFGYIAKKQIRQSNGGEGGSGMATAGIVLGWIGVATLVAVIVIGIIAAATSHPSNTGGYYAP
jgi:hypothetical protein